MIPVALNCEMYFAHEIMSPDTGWCLDHPEGQVMPKSILSGWSGKEENLPRASHWNVATPTLFSAWWNDCRVLTFRLTGEPMHVVAATYARIHWGSHRKWRTCFRAGVSQVLTLTRISVFQPCIKLYSALVCLLSRLSAAKPCHQQQWSGLHLSRVEVKNDFLHCGPSAGYFKQSRLASTQHVVLVSLGTSLQALLRWKYHVFTWNEFSVSLHRTGMSPLGALNHNGPKPTHTAGLPCARF